MGSDRRQGVYFPEKLKKKHTAAELIDQYIEALPLLGVKRGEDTVRHLNWWKGKIGKYTLNHINSDLIKKQRQELLDEVSPKGTKLSQAKVNRYLVCFSGALSYRFNPFYSAVDTFDFQAEAFYLKSSYKLVSELKNSWFVHSKFFLRKNLS